MKRFCISALLMAGVALGAVAADVKAVSKSMNDCEADRIAAVMNGERPASDIRLFSSKAVEDEIKLVKKLLKNEKLAKMFENCFPNTLDTTVHFRLDDEGKPETFV